MHAHFGYPKVTKLFEEVVGRAERIFTAKVSGMRRSCFCEDFALRAVKDVCAFLRV